jgi:hypothetical protein
MKRITKFLALAFIMLAFTVSTFAQVTANASATATIVSPIAISKVTDMNFGNVAASVALGTVVLDPAGTRTATGGVTLPATVGTVTAASFTVTGTAGYTYSITLPALATTISFGAFTMSVDTWTSTPTVAGGGLLTGGTQTLNVGATLHVAANQNAGTYSSAADFQVKVNYN